MLWLYTGGVNLNYMLYINIAVHITLQIMVLVGLVYKPSSILSYDSKDRTCLVACSVFDTYNFENKSDYTNKLTTHLAFPARLFQERLIIVFWKS